MAAALFTTIWATGNLTNHVEWIGAMAVFTMTRRVSVADRLRESEVARPERSVECVAWYGRYLVIGELLWMIYFLLLGAYSALVGVGLMLLYPPWRRLYRRFWPLGRNQVPPARALK